MDYYRSSPKNLMPMLQHSLDLDNAFDAEQFEWLLQWSKLFFRETDMDHTDLQMHVLSVDSQNQKLTQELDQLRELLRDGNQDNQELQKALEKVTYDFQFANSQKEQLTIERDGMILQLEEKDSQLNGIVAKLKEQIRSMQVIISESQLQISQKEQMRLELLKNLEAQEQMHLQQMEAQKQSLEENNLDSITCSICLVAWDASGDHRVVSLRCGHLFGDSCIRAYLMRSTDCPICRQTAYAQDLRYIFGRHIMPNPTQCSQY
ncbi:E3 ubiquitin-protein ligase RFWD3-like isoform X2 [Drosophila gunungcola]|nr:E3 ubiquitin-protein ligase RFWD3-like isoform X2 [Drosophila gunungcola]XP_052854482.1 E3 ubiquitin-protein ligase RFWD3-like isoform X2 [Drosophila gunungcola]